MQATRRARLQSVIIEELSTQVRGLKDPRIPGVTFTRCEVTEDGEQATVWLTLFGSMTLEDDVKERKTRDAIAGLSSASGFLRRHLASILTIRHVPTLIFKEDRGMENSIRVHELLKQIGAGATAAVAGSAFADPDAKGGLKRTHGSRSSEEE